MIAFNGGLELSGPRYGYLDRLENDRLEEGVTLE